jgi:hypothetical protein
MYIMIVGIILSVVSITVIFQAIWEAESHKAEILSLYVMLDVAEIK